MLERRGARDAEESPRVIGLPANLLHATEPVVRPSSARAQRVDELFQHLVGAFVVAELEVAASGLVVDVLAERRGEAVVRQRALAVVTGARDVAEDPPRQRRRSVGEDVVCSFFREFESVRVQQGQGKCVVERRLCRSEADCLRRVLQRAREIAAIEAEPRQHAVGTGVEWIHLEAAPPQRL